MFLGLGQTAGKQCLFEGGHFEAQIDAPLFVVEMDVIFPL